MTPTYQFRDKPLDQLQEEQVITILQRFDFYCKNWHPQGRGIRHDLDAALDKPLVIDRTGGLMWQQGGSTDRLNFEQSGDYISQLCSRREHDFNDWRLPTLEEAMALMESWKNKSGMYLNPLFDQAQAVIWTADQHNPAAAWVVSFRDGGCDYCSLSQAHFVKAVRRLG